MTKDNAKQKHDPQAMLFAAFDFTEDDLVRNAAGELSGWQRAIQKCMRMIGLGHVALAVIFMLLGLALLADMYSPSLLMLYAFAGIAFVLCISVAFGFWDIPAMMRAISILRDNRVAQVEGFVQLDIIHRRSQSSRYLLRINGIRFELTHKQFLAFKNGDPYRIHYVPRANKILSVVWLPGENPFIPQDAADETIHDSDDAFGGGDVNDSRIDSLK